MKKITILILISFFILGCKTKRTLKNESKEVVKEEISIKQDKTEKEVLIEVENKNIKEFKIAEVKEEKKDIEIVGKVDKENPITYYNIVDGDTIDLFRITGNADFIFRSSVSAEKSNVNNNSSTNASNTKESEKSLSNAVENVKSAVKEVQEKTVEVVKKDFTIGSYVVFLIWGLAIIALLVFILWLKKSTWWTSIINKFK